MSLQYRPMVKCDHLDCEEDVPLGDLSIEESRPSLAVNGWAYQRGLDLCPVHSPDRVAELQLEPPVGLHLVKG